MTQISINNRDTKIKKKDKASLTVKTQILNSTNQNNLKEYLDNLVMENLKDHLKIAMTIVLQYLLKNS